jgi:hypothetical protein
MRRRITPQILDPAVRQALIDHKQATLQVILSQIPNTTTFAELGELMGDYTEWVRIRPTKPSDRLFRIAKRYLAQQDILTMAGSGVASFPSSKSLRASDRCVAL